MRALRSRGFTLVELMIVVAIVGVLAALAIYGIRKYIANAKTAEARNNVGRMAKDASSAYQREGMAGSLLPAQGAAGASRRLCLSANPVPANVSDLAGRKYQADPAEWSTGQPKNSEGGHEGFACLKFAVPSPQYFQYKYECSAGDTAAAGLPGAKFSAMAVGDLDGDGDTSLFRLDGEIKKEGTNVELFVSPAMYEDKSEE